MTSKQPRDMPASVRARLLNVAKLNNEAFDLVLVRFAIERLLYRLSQSQYRDRFVVKGATMFRIWSNLSHRPTRDLDLLGTGEPDVDRFVEIFRDLCVQEVENDGLVFVTDSVSAMKMKEDEEYEGIRMKFDAFLGPARIPVQVDIGFGDARYCEQSDERLLRSVHALYAIRIRRRSSTSGPSVLRSNVARRVSQQHFHLPLRLSFPKTSKSRFSGTRFCASPI